VLAGRPLRRVDGRRAHDWARGRSGGGHFTAAQYGYVPLGRHLVNAWNSLSGDIVLAPSVNSFSLCSLDLSAWLHRVC